MVVVIEIGETGPVIEAVEEVETEVLPVPGREATATPLAYQQNFLNHLASTDLFIQNFSLPM